MYNVQVQCHEVTGGAGGKYVFVTLAHDGGEWSAVLSVHFMWCSALYPLDKFFASIFVICIIDGFHLWAEHVIACTVVQIYAFGETSLHLSCRSSEFEH